MTGYSKEKMALPSGKRKMIAGVSTDGGLNANQKIRLNGEFGDGTHMRGGVRIRCTLRKNFTQFSERWLTPFLDENKTGINPLFLGIYPLSPCIYCILFLLYRV
jgi:hypothetical protein